MIKNKTVIFMTLYQKKIMKEYTAEMKENSQTK